MRFRAELVLTLCALSVLALAALPAAADTAALELEVTDYPHLVFDGDRPAVVVELSNQSSSSLREVFVRASTGETKQVGDIIANGQQQVTLFLENYQMGANEVEIHATFAGGASARRLIRFEVRPVSESMALRIVDAPPSISDGMTYVARIEVQNLRQEAVTGARVVSGENVLYDIGQLAANEAREIDLRVEDYLIGVNSLSLMAENERGRAAPLTLEFEVRPQHEAIALRVVDAPQSIHEGMVFTARLEVQNLWRDAVSGTRIMNGEESVFYVGVLEGDELRQIELRLEDYEMGLNRLNLIGQHEHGTSAAVPLDFTVIPAESAVKTYLASSNSPVYASETLELSIAIAASEEAEITELEFVALTEGVQPAGYYLGAQVAAEEEVQVIEVESLLGPTEPEEEEEPDRVVRGRELVFQLNGADAGPQKVLFQIRYRLGSAVVERQFTIEPEFLPAPGVVLIQAQRIVAAPGEETLVTLHVANGLAVEVDAVRVVPVGDIEASPSEFFIGSMAPDDFLPAHFKVQTDDVEDGDYLRFKAVYRVGHRAYETDALRAPVNLEENHNTNPALYIGPIVAVALLALLLWTMRRRRWTR